MLKKTVDQKVSISDINDELLNNLNEQLMNSESSTTEECQYIFKGVNSVFLYISITLCIFFALLHGYLLFIGIGTMILSGDLSIQGMVISITAFIILCVNIVLIIKLDLLIKYKNRFYNYADCLGFKKLEYVESLALSSNQSEDLVIKDLNAAIKQKLIPQGHFTQNNLVFIVSDNIYDRYVEKQEIYDRYFQRQLEERHCVNAHTKRISKIIESGEQYIKEFNNYKVLVQEKTVSNKIERLSNVVSLIFCEIDLNPDKANLLGVFLNYYLPTTKKILEEYISITEKGSALSNVSNVKKEIEDSLDKIINAYENILKKMYEEYEREISSEIEAMDTVMKKDGL